MPKSTISGLHSAMRRDRLSATHHLSCSVISRSKKQTLKADFEAYLNGFSSNVQEILDKFKFRNQIATMVDADILGAVIEKFISPDINLSPAPVYKDNEKTILRHPGLDNHGMGTIFEELIRKFNEENNEEAGEHWTPRDVVELMADLIFIPVADQIKDATYSCYDGACGTGGMLTVAQDRLLTLAARRGKKVSIHLFGQEINPETYAIAKADMLLKGDGDQAEHDGVVSPAYNVYRQKGDYYNHRYLDFLLRERSLIDVYHSLSTGIRKSRLRLYPGQFFTIDLPVPPKDEQKQIVLYLDWQVSKINQLIKSEKKEMELLKELLISLYHKTAATASETIRLKRAFNLVNDFIQLDKKKMYRKAGMYNHGRGIFLRDAVEGSNMGKSTFQAIRKDCLMISGQFAWEDAVYITSTSDEEGVASHRYYLLQSQTSDLPIEYLWAYFIVPEEFNEVIRCSHGAAGRNRPLNIDELLRTNISIPSDKDALNLLIDAVRNYMSLQKKIAAKETVLREYRSKTVSDVVTGKKTGKHGMLRSYAVILIQWIQGTGLSHIMNKAIEFKQNNPESGVKVNGKQERYNDSRDHRNIVIADTLEVIENVILFSISNYFLRFSNEYKRFHNVETFQNDWYEYVEYGTTNPLTILLQRNGFSRETSTYIRQHRDEYVVMTQGGEVKLRRSLLQSRNVGAARESADIQYNMPEIFVN